MHHAELVVLLLVLVAGLVIVANRWAIPYRCCSSWAGSP